MVAETRVAIAFRYSAIAGWGSPSRNRIEPSASLLTCRYTLSSEFTVSLIARSRATSSTPTARTSTPYRAQMNLTSAIAVA